MMRTMMRVDSRLRDGEDRGERGRREWKRRSKRKMRGAKIEGVQSGHNVSWNPRRGRQGKTGATL